MRAARADAKKFADEPIKAKADVDTAKAKAKVDELKRGGAAVKGKVDLDTKAAEAKLAALKKTAGGKFAESLSNAPAWLGPALAALPAAVTLLGAASGAATAVGATVATGGIALAAYGAVAKGVLARAATAAKAVAAAQEKYNVAVQTGTNKATAYAAEQKAILLAYHGMSPAQVELSRQLGDLSKEWSGVQKSLTPVIAMSVTPWLGGVTSGLKFLKPAVTDVSQVVDSLGHDFDSIINSPSFASFAKFIGGEGSATVNAGGGAILNFFQGFITLLPQFRPLIDDVDQGITHLGTSFLTWAQSDSARHDIQEFMGWLHDNGPLVGHLLLSIGGALKNLGSGLLGPAGGAEIRLLTGFFNLIAHLPPSFVQPVSDLAASLLLISRFGFGRKILSVGVNFAGSAAAKLFNLLTPGGSLDFTGKFGASAGMQKAADTMVGAAAEMQKAADTMVGAGAEGNGVAGAEGAAGARGAAGAEGAAGAAGAAEGGAAKAGLGISGIIAALTPVLNFAGAGAFAIYALSNAFDNVTGKAGQFVRAQAAADKATGTNILGYRKLAGQLRHLLPPTTGGLGNIPGLEKALGVGNLRGAGDEISKLAEAEKKASSMAAALAQTAFARATKQLTAEITAGHGARDQFSRDLTTASTDGDKARQLVDEYTLAIQHNGTGTAGAAQIRARMVSDFERQGLNAKQANDLVDTYTQGVLRNGDTAAAKRAARAQLIKDFENAGDSAKTAAGKVDTLIGQISDIHSKSVNLSVKASGSFTITGQSVSAGPGHKIQGGVATGGLITGPGTGTSDTAGLFALSNKEYVHNAAAVAHYGTAFMDAVNKRQLPKMAGGGLAGTYLGNPAGLGAFDQREWSATQKLIEQSDALAAISALRKDIAAARAQMMGGLGDAAGGSNAIDKYALSFLGAPYVWGGTTPAGWDCCLIGNMKVQTTTGPKDIRDIKPGDIVISWDDGKLVRSRVVRRSEPRHQQTYRLRTLHREIVASGNHPFLTLREGDPVPAPVTREPLPAAEKMARPPGQQPLQVSAEKIRDLYLAGYGMAEIGAHLGVSVGTVQRRLADTGTPSRRPAGGRRHSEWTAEWVNLEDLRRGDIIVALHHVPDDAPEPEDPYLADKRFLWLLGLAFGDGSMSRARANRVDLCVFGNLREEVQERLEDYCGKRGSETDKHGVYLFSELLATGLRRFGVDALSTERQLPAELWSLPHGHIQAFLDGYTAADGHRMKRASDPALNYKAANRGLIEGIRNLHMILGHNVTRVRETKRTRPITIRGKQVKNARSLWTFEAYETGVKTETAAADLLSRPGIAALFPSGSHFTPQRVTAIEAMEVEDTYDITVEGTHNFVAEGLVVHNSGFTSFVYHHFGIPAPRTSQEQQMWAQPSRDQAAALVFFYGTGGTATHVGLSLGDGRMVNAANPALGTLISSTAGNSGFGVPPDPGGTPGSRQRPPGLSPRITSFDSGGYLPPGLSIAHNGTGAMERLERVPHGGYERMEARLGQVTMLLSKLIGAVYDNADMTADGVAEALGGFGQRASGAAWHSART